LKAICGALACLLLLPIFVIAAMGEAFGGDGGGPSAEPVSPGSDSSAPASPGDPNDLSAKVLSNPRIHLSPAARRDVEMGRADERILRVLLILADRHDLGYVGPIASGHSYFVKGTTRVSNHVYGRAVDISVIDGRAVDASNDAAYDAARTVAALAPPLRPDELGAPWKIESNGVYSFTEGHGDHLHVGYDHK